MANFNRIILIGRLTRDPETRTFSNGGKVAKFGFAASPNRKKDPQTGQWQDEPMFIDVEAFNRGEKGTLANIVEQYLHKGSLICVEGKLHLETWDDKTTGAKRQKHKIIADTIQMLESKADAEARGHSNGGSSNNGGYGAPPPDDEDRHGGSGSGEEIPF